LGTTAAELERWPVAARAFERAAELHAVAVEREESVECLLLAGKQWLNATAEARAAHKRKQKQQKQQQAPQQQALAQPPAASSSGHAQQAAPSGGAAAPGSSSDAAAAAVQPGKQQVRASVLAPGTGTGVLQCSLVSR
jgi:hypothetical protein